MSVPKTRGALASCTRVATHLPETIGQFGTSVNVHLGPTSDGDGPDVVPGLRRFPVVVSIKSLLDPET